MAPREKTARKAMGQPFLFSPLKIRGVEFKNRVFVSPMCQYSSEDGLPTDWHLVHLGSRAVGGAALVVVEATAVSPEGRISPQDSGLWSERHAEAFARITRFIKERGAVPGIQIAHAGRKGSTPVPWDKSFGKSVPPDKGGWVPPAPSAVPFDAGYPLPREMSVADVEKAARDFGKAARLARQAGFEVLELHFAHGYLVHEFLSPLSNHRQDSYGGAPANRMRLALAIAENVRRQWPEEFPLFARISATDWSPGGWDLPDSVALAKSLKGLGVDLIDCSSGGMVPHAQIPLGPGYQTPFSEAIRREAEILTGAVGLITEPRQAEGILAQGKADAVFLARELLRDPYWPLRAAKALGADAPWPKQYERAKN
ncbi:MAG TPA: NADH:flavin oxidoreductase/NADH oxidase [Elusimicrobiota bacterium]|nr:NADH:flavin oxidoreductase/NADH oxidase [Elusimicrobiota bacterium]